MLTGTFDELHGKAGAPEVRPAPAHRKAGPFCRRVLVAEDNADMRSWLRYILEQQGAEVIECADGLALLEQLSEHVLAGSRSALEMVITDVQMPYATGLEAAEALASVGGSVPMLLLTAFGSEQMRERVSALRHIALLDKPFAASDLLAAVERLLDGESR